MMCLCLCVSVCVALKEALQKTCLMQLLEFHLNVAIVLTSITFAFPVILRCDFPTTRNCFELVAA